MDGDLFEAECNAAYDRVTAGVEFIDSCSNEKYWYHGIEIDQIDMLYTGKCILSLCFGTYKEGMSLFARTNNVDKNSNCDERTPPFTLVSLAALI